MSTTDEVKGYEKEEKLLKGIKNSYSQRRGHSHTKVRSMVPGKWLFSGALRKRQPLCLAIVSAHRRENNLREVREEGDQPLQQEGVMLLAPSQAEC